jgi:manganese/zinc/iron transport system permease protein
MRLAEALPFAWQLHSWGVLVAATGLGAAAGTVGVFLLLRHRSLLGDVISHATLPGVAGAFLLASYWGWSIDSRWLLLGGALSGSLAAVATLMLGRWTTLPQDTILGGVLGTFFAAGALLMGLVQQTGGGFAAGLEHLLLGQVAVLDDGDITRLLSWSAGVTLGCWLLRKELQLICFDPQLARLQGWPVTSIDGLLMTAAVIMVLVGMQAVGIILVIAMLVIPAASAGLWVGRLESWLLVAAGLGGLSGLLGTLLSSWIEDCPSGPAIVLASVALFSLSWLLAPARGWIPRRYRQVRQKRQVDEQHLLRALYELLESLAAPAPASGPDAESLFMEPVDTADLARHRSTIPKRLLPALRRLAGRGQLVMQRGHQPQVRLTCRGLVAARQAVRHHRLLEWYFLQGLELPLEAADRQADAGEHRLPPELVRQLEGSLPVDTLHRPQVPVSPHPLGGSLGEDTRGDSTASGESLGQPVESVPQRLQPPPREPRGADGR